MGQNINIPGGPKCFPMYSGIHAACLAVLLLALAPAFAQNQTAARLARAFDAIDRAAVASTTPGFVIGITDRNRTLKIGAYGYANLKSKTRVTPETLFEIGSVSKSFTAISFIQLFDEGRFDPQEPVTKYLPWFALKSKYRAITGHDLLTHTSGLQNYRADLSSVPFAALSVHDFEPSYAPGEHYWCIRPSTFPPSGFSGCSNASRSVTWRRP